MLIERGERVVQSGGAVIVEQQTHPHTDFVFAFALTGNAVVVYQDRVKLHLPSASPVKALLWRVTEIRYRCRPPPRGQPA